MTENRFDPRLELESFKDLWSAGYYEGDPLDPLGPSNYLALGYMSVLHATYLCCIKPYVSSTSVALEIGPGRGAWTKTLLGAREVWCLDALSAEHNGFWSYVGSHEHVAYHQVEDFTCSTLPDDYFSYLFSFGCFCHLPFDGAAEYMRNLYAKLRAGSHGFILISDYHKYNRAIENWSALTIGRALSTRRDLPARKTWSLLGSNRKRPQLKDPREGTQPRPGRWYNIGTDRFCRLLEQIGYKVVDRDVGVNHRDPVVHFAKDP